MKSPFRIHTPGEAARLRDMPDLGAGEFREAILTSVRLGGRITALFAEEAAGGAVRLQAVIAHGATGTVSLASTKVRDTFKALTPDCPQAHWFEREIAETWSLRAEGHPWPKPIRFQPPRRSAAGIGAVPPAPAIGVMEFFQVRGDEVHEVAVGPVHAGIIEPGHFRFQCHGENVLHLEISLGYQHRGVERSLVGGPGPRTLHLMETLAGDSTVAHAMAYCEVLEALSGAQVPPRAQALRGVALELERLANHTGDLGALAADVGFLPTSAHCGRIRGDFLNMTALICGNRFGRSLVIPGGVRFDVEGPRAAELLERLSRALDDVTVAVDLLWESPSVMARFETTGAISRRVCEDLGLVGVAARASGLERDARQEFPSGIFRFFQIPVSTCESGDVFARAMVRWLEMKRSVAFIREQITALPDGPIRTGVGAVAPESQGTPGSSPAPEPEPPLASDSMAVAFTEGWRGEICHAALTDGRGRLRTYKVVDPSFHNWMGLALALRGQQISDFPLCNKSFNLSYCGHDL